MSKKFSDTLVCDLKKWPSANSFSDQLELERLDRKLPWIFYYCPGQEGGAEPGTFFSLYLRIEFAVFA